MQEQMFGVATDPIWLQVLQEAQTAGQEGIAEQAWQCITEFGPEYKAE